MSAPVKLKYLGSFQGGSGFPDNEQGIKDAELPFYKVKDLGKSQLYLTKTENYISRETARSLGATVIAPNSIVFAKVGAALLLQRFRFLSMPSCIDNNMIGFSVNSKTEHRFVRYSLSSFSFSEIVNPGAVPSLNEEQIKNLVIYPPPLQTQTKIANYLDRKTAELDKLIEAKKNLLKLLNEKKRALIAHAVTHGLNPDAPLKDSGIPWLGKIPAHWQVERSKWLLPEIDKRSETGVEELLTVSHLTGVTKRSDKDVNMFMAESLEGYKKCNRNDLVINTLWAWMGAMGISPIDGITSPAYNVYRPTSKLLPEYLDMLVRMPKFISEITRYSKGVWSSRLRLYPEGLYETYLPVPPMNEQKQIVADVNKQLKHFKKLQSVTEKTITLMQERRTALISAAVTGKLEEAYA